MTRIPDTLRVRLRWDTGPDTSEKCFLGQWEVGEINVYGHNIRARIVPEAIRSALPDIPGLGWAREADTPINRESARYRVEQAVLRFVRHMGLDEFVLGSAVAVPDAPVVEGKRGRQIRLEEEPPEHETEETGEGSDPFPWSDPATVPDTLAPPSVIGLGSPAEPGTLLDTFSFSYGEMSPIVALQRQVELTTQARNIYRGTPISLSWDEDLANRTRTLLVYRASD